MLAAVVSVHSKIGQKFYLSTFVHLKQHEAVWKYERGILFFRIYSFSDSPATRHYTETAIRQCTLLQISSSSSSSSLPSSSLFQILLLRRTTKHRDCIYRGAVFRVSRRGRRWEVEGQRWKEGGFWQNHSANQTLNLLELDTFHNFTFARDLLTFHLLHL